jgi:hypothetical protein
MGRRVLESIDWVINKIFFPIRLRRWYFDRVTAIRNCRAHRPLPFSLRTAFIGKVVIRNHPVRLLVPKRVRERWKNEVAGALARRT